MEQGIHAMLSPLVLTAVIIVLMMQIAFWRHATTSWLLSCVGITLAGLAVFSTAGMNGVDEGILVTPILVSDNYSLFFSLLIIFATLLTALLARDYLEHREGENEEFYLLLMLSALGGLILVSATHLASFLLGLELLGVALYALIAYPERGHLPLEASVKYLVLSGAASAILLFGFALLYAALGTLSFAEIGAQLTGFEQTQDQQLLILIATGMIFTGIGFKLSLVPFHMWTPDVYQGAPAPVTGFLATISKGAIFAALLRFFVDAQLQQYPSLMLSISLIAIASMLIGNLLALKQDNLKRLLAYSSIAHLGYLLIVLVVYSASANPISVEASAFYLTAYVVTTLAAFSLLSIISSHQESDTIEDIRGLFWRQPWLALMLTVAMLSLAGIPLTAGFVGKFYIFTAGIDASLWLLITALVIGSGIGIYYYLRVVFAMASGSGDHAESSQANQLADASKLSWVARFVICLLLFMMFYLGVLPQTFIEHLGKLSI